ncbi:MAG: hypothetical protein QOJ68_696 [Blastococcus sp.]|jgi:hypothetical protein|nr:hypothetical protein [Blastococcus sp.]
MPSVGFPVIDDVLDEAIGRRHRPDPVTGATSGPAGNAELTAWTGLVLLVLIAVELVTLLDVRGLLSWHVVVGVLLTAVAALKIASTGWRIVRYYTGNRPYRTAGPPPLLLRILGPLVIAGTVAVLVSGLWLIAVGPTSSRQPLATVLGQRLDWLSIHQASFIVFAVVVGVHTLARLIPAFNLGTGRSRRDGGVGRLRGWGPRLAVVTATLVAGALAAVLILPAASGWQNERDFRDFPPGSAPSHR